MSNVKAPDTVRAPRRAKAVRTPSEAARVAAALAEAPVYLAIETAARDLSGYLSAVRSADRTDALTLALLGD